MSTIKLHDKYFKKYIPKDKISEAVTHLVKQVATRNRVLVTFDWMKSTLFGRDITRL